MSEHEDHGHSVAAWTTVTIVIVASAIMAAAVLWPNVWLFVGGAVLAVVGSSRARSSPWPGTERPTATATRPPRSTDGGPSVTTVLESIVAGVREDLAQRERRTSFADVEAAVLAARPALDAEAVLRGAGPVAHRRGQAREPEQGRPLRHPRPRRPRRGLRGRRRERRVGAHRAAPLRRQPRRPRRRARRGRRARAAQGLHGQRLPAVGGPRPRRRPRAAHRRRPDRRRARRDARPGPASSA